VRYYAVKATDRDSFDEWIDAITMVKRNHEKKNEKSWKVGKTFSGFSGAVLKTEDEELDDSVSDGEEPEAEPAAAPADAAAASPAAAEDSDDEEDAAAEAAMAKAAKALDSYDEDAPGGASDAAGLEGNERCVCMSSEKLDASSCDRSVKGNP